MTPALTIGYRRGLSDLSPKELRAACNEALKRHHEFVPTPGQLREYLLDFRESTPVERKKDYCERCGNSGWYVAKAGDTAQRCTHQNQ